MTPRFDRPARGQRGFTLLELIVAMTVFGLVGLGIFGVLVLGARSAGSGEKVTEHARRYRVANEILSKQIAGAECVRLPRQEDGLGSESSGEDDEESSSEPFFFGNEDAMEFVTTSPQRPDASGMSIVRYWVEDGALRMSESPVFTAYGTGKGLGRSKIDESVSTILLYDVASVTFAYQRESDTDEWLETWAAADEERLPACVRIDVRPSAVDGPDFYHEIPLMVATFNQIADWDDECRSRRVRRDSSQNRAARGGGGEDDVSGGGSDTPDDEVDDEVDDPDDDVDDSDDIEDEDDE